MDLSHGGSSSTNNNNNNDFIDLIKNNREHHEEEEDEEDNDSLIHHKNGGGIKTDDIVPSYDFQPIRSLPDNSSSSFSRPWNSDSNSNSKVILTTLNPNFINYLVFCASIQLIMVNFKRIRLI